MLGEEPCKANERQKENFQQISKNNLRWVPVADKKKKKRQKKHTTQTKSATFILPLNL